jgi:elongation factor G
MDRIGADFFQSVQSMVDRLGAKPVPVQLPLGREDDFRGVIDLIEMRGLTWTDALGANVDETEIPAELQEQASEYHHQLIDAIAEKDEELLETYLEDEDAVTPEMIRRALRRATLDAEVTPVLLGSAFKNKGIQPLLDAVVDYLPSPLDVPPVHGLDPRTEHELSRRPALDEPFAALAFKVMSDPYVGRLTYIRVYSGQVKAGDRVLNTATGRTERISRILQMHANHREEREEIGAGEIAAMVGLKTPSTGETLAVETAPITLESMDFPEPVISVAIEPKTKGDQDKLATGLQRLSDEDPTFRVRTDQETGQTLISGMGELHLEIIVDRLMREFNVDANVGRPQVAYRETITKPVQKIEGRFVRQSGGRGQYGHVYIDVEPSEPGEGYEFIDRITGGDIPKEYIGPSTSASRRRWSPASSPVTRWSTSCLARRRLVPRRRLERDGVQGRRLHGVQGGDAAGEACACSSPVMAVEVVSPEEYLGDVMGDLNARRGHVEGPGAARQRAGDQGARPTCDHVRLCNRPALDDAGTSDIHHAVRSLRGSASIDRGRDRRRPDRVRQRRRKEGNGKAEVRAQQAASQRRHDRSHRPRARRP